MRRSLQLGAVLLLGAVAVWADVDPEPLGFGWFPMPDTVTVNGFVCDRFPVDTRPCGFTPVTTIPTGSVFDGPLTFSDTVFHCQIGVDPGCDTWALGRQPDVYYLVAAKGRTSLTLTMPGGAGGFAFWAQPAVPGNHNLTVRGYSQFGDFTPLAQVVTDPSGALGFGFMSLWPQEVHHLEFLFDVDFLIGDFYGHKIVPLDDYGACCFPDGSCDEMYSLPCQQAGGTFTFHGAPCWPNPCWQPPEGACCFFDGSCGIRSSYECAAEGGDYRGDGTECGWPDDGCPPKGACCLGGAGECMETTAFGCGLEHGFFMEGWRCWGVYCPPFGACCFRDDSCQVLGPSECALYSGVYVGDGLTCLDQDFNGKPDSCEGPAIWSIRGLYSREGSQTRYLEGVPLTETFVAEVDWRDNPPGEVWFVTPMGSYRGASDPGDPDLYVFTCDMSEVFEAGGGLLVIAESPGRGPLGERLATFIDIVEKPRELLDAVIEAAPQGSQLKYVAEEMRQGANYAIDQGLDAMPDWMHIFGKKAFKFGQAVNGAVEIARSGRVTSKLYTTPEKKIRIAGLLFQAGATGQFWWDFKPTDGVWGPGGEFTASASIAGPVPAEPIRFIIPVVFIPVYFSGYIEATADAEFELSGWTVELPPEPVYHAALELAPGARASVGIGCEYIVSIEGHLGGSARFRLDFPKAAGHSTHLTDLKVTLSAGVTFREFYFFKQTFDVSQTWSVNTRDGMNLLIPGPMEIVPRDYLYAKGGYAVFAANEPARGALRYRGTQEQPFQLNVFDRSTPDLEALGDDLLAVWVHDDPNRTSVNRTEVVAARYDSGSGTWSSPPVAIADDGTADFQPQLARLPGGDTLLVWTDARDVLIEPGAPGDACVEPCVPPGDEQYVVTPCDEPCLTRCEESCAEECMYAPDPLACQQLCVASCEPACEEACEAQCRIKCKAEEMKRVSEISAARCDGTTGQWVAPLRLTDNDVMDHTPRLAAAADGTALVVWVSNAEGNPLGSVAAPNTLRWARYDGASWSAPADIATVPSTTGLALAYRNGEGALVFAADTNDAPQTPDDSELFAVAFDGVAWGPVTRLTNDTAHDAGPQAVFDHLGNLLLVWYRAGDLVMATDLALSDLHTIVDLPATDSMGVGDFRLATGPTGQIALVWQEPSEDLVDIWSSAYDVAYQVWSQPQRLTSDSAEEHSLEQALAPTFDAGGDLVMLYDKVHLGTRSETVVLDGEVITIDNIPDPLETDLYFLRHDLLPRPTISADTVTWDPPNPHVDDVVTITAQVHNTGSLSATGIQLDFYDGDPNNSGMLIGSASTPGPLPGGETIPLSIVWTVPAPPAPHDIYLVVGQTRGEDARGNRALERDEGDTAVIALLRPDLQIDYIDVEDLSATERRLTVRVSNSSGLPIAGTTVDLRRDGAEGELLTTLMITDELPPDGFVDVEWLWQNAGPFPGGIAKVWARVDPGQALSEFDETNNERIVLVQGAVLVDDCNENGYSDTSDIAAGRSEDCNVNFVPDECDIARGTSQDANEDGVPDECTAVALTVDVDGQGSVALAPPGGTYWLGESVELTANPEIGWRFDHWAGAVGGATNPVVLVMDAPKSVTAAFVPQEYALTLYTAGQGTVELSPAGGTYGHGTTVTLTAAGLTGWHFSHWGGALSGGQNPAELLMDSPKTVSAYFEHDYYALTLNVTGQGGVQLAPAGGSYTYGTIVELTAVPGEAACFTEWGGALSGALNPATLLMDGPKSVSAAFAPDCNGNGLDDAGDVIGAGDLDADGDVDAGDLAALGGALNGPERAPVVAVPSCLEMVLTAFDADADNDLDLIDYAVLQQLATE